MQTLPVFKNNVLIKNKPAGVVYAVIIKAENGIVSTIPFKEEKQAGILSQSLKEVYKRAAG